MTAAGGGRCQRQQQTSISGRAPDKVPPNKVRESSSDPFAMDKIKSCSLKSASPESTAEK